MKSKKSQITAFIIIGVVIIAGIVFYFLIINKKIPIITQPVMSDPETYIDKCAKDSADEAIGIMLPQGGYINPSHYKLFGNNKVQYLCYTNLFYKTCINQEPLYTKHLQDEITNYIFDKVNRCFQQIKTDMQQEGYSVEMSGMNISTYLATGIVRITIDRKFEMTRNEVSKKFDKFVSVFSSPLYKLGILAQEISNEEAKFCYFEYVGFNLVYPEFKIIKKNVGSGLDASKIYVIEDKNTGKKLNIAVRSCAVPPAF